jgi:hypothetical protein
MKTVMTAALAVVAILAAPAAHADPGLSPSNTCTVMRGLLNGNPAHDMVVFGYVVQTMNDKLGIPKAEASHIVSQHMQQGCPDLWADVVAAFNAGDTCPADGHPTCPHPTATESPEG